MKQDDRRANIILAVIGIIPIVWLALLIAPAVSGGLPEILQKLLTVFNNPFHIEFCEDAETTGDGKNTARRFGATQKLSIRNTAKSRLPRIRR